MPIPVGNLPVTPYQVNGAAVGNGTIHRAEHHIYTLAEARINLAINVHGMNPMMRTVSGALAGGGDAIYLRFFNDKITSVRLPVPPPVGVDFFFTDNMSGCKFFVDSIPGSNDLIAYHANTTAHGPGAAAHADVQTVGAAGLLDGYHANAQGDWGLGALVNVAALAKPAYFLSAGNAERRKQGHGRGNVGFMGGCTVVGYPAGGTWQFYYQTWGDVGYTRTTGIAKALFTFHWNYLHKRRVEGAQHNAGYANMRVLGSARFH